MQPTTWAHFRGPPLNFKPIALAETKYCTVQCQHSKKWARKNGALKFIFSAQTLILNQLKVLSSVQRKKTLRKPPLGKGNALEQMLGGCFDSFEGTFTFRSKPHCTCTSAGAVMCMPTILSTLPCILFSFCIQGHSPATLQVHRQRI